MGIFGKILAAVGFEDNDAKVAEALAPVSVEAVKEAKAAREQAAQAAPASAAQAAPASQAVAVVDVVAQLEKQAAAHGGQLNWKTSIVDLLKLLDLDSSFAARKELAKELCCPEEKMGDSAQMNMWLHKTVLQKLADNGGNIPRDLLA
ncbi:MAG: DUF3597 family protein [Gammaproteobacteria bacterium]|nr:DUF3597 family protein [Gammaproteobacteria bacterium]